MLTMQGWECMLVQLFCFLCLLQLVAMYSTTSVGRQPISTHHKLTNLFMHVPGKRNQNKSLSGVKTTVTAKYQKILNPKLTIIARKPFIPVSTSTNANDSWKVLIKSLEGKKSDIRYGKIGRSSVSEVVETSKSSKLVNNIPSNKDELQCIHFEECSGCTLKSDFINSPVMQRANDYFRVQKVPFKIHIGNITSWRTHVKLAVQPMSKWGGVKFGLYRMNSHIVESIPHCRVQHPIINEAAENIRSAALDAGVRGYIAPTANQAASGELRYVQLSLERSTGKVQLVLVWNAKDAQDAITTLPRLVKLLKSRHPNMWHSITVNFNTMSNNNIFDYEPSKWRLLWGLPYLKEHVHNATFYFKPQIFRQANLDAFGEKIIPFVAKFIPPESTVTELYAGIGLMGINIAPLTESVMCSDSNEFVNEVFQRGVTSLTENDSDKVSFECIDASTAVTDGYCEDADVLLVDPPRRGLQDTVSLFLLNKLEATPLPSRLKRLIYVGCGYDALERDCRTLVSSGLWKIRAAEGFAIFPGSDHLETVVVLDRALSRK